MIVVVAAAAFVAQHSVFPIVAGWHPDQQDKKTIVSFGKQCAKAITAFSGNEKSKSRAIHHTVIRTQSHTPMGRGIETRENKYNGSFIKVLFCCFENILRTFPCGFSQTLYFISALVFFDEDA